MPELCALAELKMMISASVRPSDNLTLFDEIKWDFYHLETFPHHTDLTWPSLEQSKFVEWCPFPKLASARIEMMDHFEVSRYNYFYVRYLFYLKVLQCWPGTGPPEWHPTNILIHCSQWTLDRELIASDIKW